MDRQNEEFPWKITAFFVAAALGAFVLALNDGRDEVELDQPPAMEQAPQNTPQPSAP